MIVGIIGMLFTIVFSALNKLDDGESHKFHDFSGWPGFFLVLSRIVVFIFFYLATVRTEKEIKGSNKFFNQL